MGGRVRGGEGRGGSFLHFIRVLTSARIRRSVCSRSSVPAEETREAVLHALSRSANAFR